MMKIQRGIYQSDSFSLLLFVIAVMPLHYILRECTGVYKFHKSQEKIKHFMYMDDLLKIKRSWEPDANKKNIQPGYRNGIWQWKMCYVDNESWWKRKNVKYRLFKSRKAQDTWREGKLHLLGNIGSWRHQIGGYERKHKKDYFRRTENVLETKLCSKNLIKEINIWTVLCKILGT